MFLSGGFECNCALGFVPSEPEPQPILPAELPISGNYHSRTKPILKGVKFVQEKLSVRPRLRIRRPGWCFYFLFAFGSIQKFIFYAFVALLLTYIII